MREFDDIYLAWRSGQGQRRHIIGILKKATDGSFSFGYDKAGVDSAKKEGLNDYAGLPYSETPYTGGVLEFFAQRLIKSVRGDVQQFYDFWEIDKQYVTDKFYLLAHTQGLLPTDNFEFLADYNPIDGLHFVTDLASISLKQLPPNFIKVGDILTYKLESSNAHDEYAVSVYHQGKEIGYIKKIHSKVFHKTGGENFELKVKAIDQNGVIKRVFVCASN